MGKLAQSDPMVILAVDIEKWIYIKIVFGFFLICERVKNKNGLLQYDD
jgi:hypothetical protein